MRGWLAAGLIGAVLWGCNKPAPQEAQAPTPVPPPASAPATPGDADGPRAEGLPGDADPVARHRLHDPNQLGDLYTDARAEAEASITPENAKDKLLELERLIDQDLRRLKDGE